MFSPGTKVEVSETLLRLRLNWSRTLTSVTLLNAVPLAVPLLNVMVPWFERIAIKLSSLLDLKECLSIYIMMRTWQSVTRRAIKWRIRRWREVFGYTSKWR